MKPPFYYSPIIRLAMPFYRHIVHKKSHHLPTYEREVAERFGQKYLPIPTNNPVDNLVNNAVDNLENPQYSNPNNKGIIWCHAVSLGELNTAYPLLKILLNQGFRLWITSTTQTGFRRVGELFGAELGKTVNHSFVPVDNLSIIQKFLSHVRPVMAIFIETELWANILYELHRQRIPSVMVNARLTQKSFDGYARLARLSRSMMENLTVIIAQDKVSADRFYELGAKQDKIHVADSLKWASFAKLSDKNEQLLMEIQSWQIHDRPIWLAASTHDGEESLMIEAHQKLLEQDARALLIIVPRHPERFDAAATLCQSSGLITHRRSHGDVITPKTQIYLADSMGELMAWYAVCDVAVVAGSFVDVGGHNPIEPAALAKPVIMGRFVKNCETLVSELANALALVQSDANPDTLAQAVATWLFDKHQATAAGRNGANLAAQKQHADRAQADILLQILHDDGR